MKQNSNKYLIIYAAYATSLLMASCSDDDNDDHATSTSAASRIVSLSAPVTKWQDGRTATRASIADLAAPDATLPDTIGVWGYKVTDHTWMKRNDWSVSAIGMDNAPFTYNTTDQNYQSGTWDATTNTASSDAYPWTSDIYRFYAYAPYREIPSANDATTASVIPSYDPETNTVTLANLPAVSMVDYLVAKDVKTHTYPGDDIVVQLETTQHTNLTVDYSFTHLCACVRLAFALDKTYAKLRYIDIRQVQIAVHDEANNGTYTYTQHLAAAEATTQTSAPALHTRSAEDVSATEETTDTEDTADTEEVVETHTLTPADTLVYTDADQVTHWYLGKTKGSDQGWYPADTYCLYSQCYLRPQPCSKAPIDLSVTYDVYDLTGQMTRKGAVATSSLTLDKTTITTYRTDTETNTEVKYLEAGYYYTILINIVPDYLYVLSDNDAAADMTIKAGS